MEQTTLKHKYLDGSPCWGRLFWIWGLYGVAAAQLWRLAGPTVPGHAAAWAVALVAGAALWLATREP
jgi:hypothetical protein